MGASSFSQRLPEPLRRRMPEALVLALSLLTIFVGTVMVKTMPYENGLAWDSGQYAAIVRHGPMKSGAVPPLAFRILVPWLAHFLPGDIVLRFRFLNGVAIVLIPQLYLRLAEAHGLKTARTTAFVLLFVLFHELTSWYYFCPVMVDLPAIALLLAAVLASRTSRPVTLALVLVLGAFAKEIVLWAIVYDLVATRRRVFSVGGLLRGLLVYGPAALTFVLVRKVVPVSVAAVDYYRVTAQQFLHATTTGFGPVRVCVALADALGPLLLLVFLGSGRAVKLARRFPEVVALALVGVPFVFIGGTNITLFCFYLFPGVGLLAIAACGEPRDRMWYVERLPAFVWLLYGARRYFIGWPTNINDYLRTGAFWMTEADAAWRLLIAISALSATAVLVRLRPAVDPGERARRRGS